MFSIFDYITPSIQLARQATGQWSIVHLSQAGEQKLRANGIDLRVPAIQRSGDVYGIVPRAQEAQVRQILNEI